MYVPWCHFRSRTVLCWPGRFPFLLSIGASQVNTKSETASGKRGAVVGLARGGACMPEGRRSGRQGLSHIYIKREFGLKSQCCSLPWQKAGLPFSGRCGFHRGWSGWIVIDCSGLQRECIRVRCRVRGQRARVCVVWQCDDHDAGGVRPGVRGR